MSEHKVHTHFPGRLIFIGFGSIGQGVLPLIMRHVGGLTADRITIVTADDAGREEAAKFGIKILNHPLTRENFRHVLDPLVGRGDFVLNLSVDVSSVALIKLCHEKGALYLDTCIEPWPGGYTDPNIPASRRTNYALREEVLELRKGWTNGPTAVITHGANPGLVSHFVKQALLDIAGATGRRGRRSEEPRRLGKPRQGTRRQGHPHRRARHAGFEQAEDAGRVRQYLVGRRLRQRGQPAGRARLGNARAPFPARRAPARFRTQERDLPDATRLRDARAHLDARGEALPRLPDHARRVDLDLGFPDGPAERSRGLPADRALRLSPVGQRGALRARILRTQFPACRNTSGS